MAVCKEGECALGWFVGLQPKLDLGMRVRLKIGYIVCIVHMQFLSRNGSYTVVVFLGGLEKRTRLDKARSISSGARQQKSQEHEHEQRGKPCGPWIDLGVDRPSPGESEKRAQNAMNLQFQSPKGSSAGLAGLRCLLETWLPSVSSVDSSIVRVHPHLINW